MIFVNRKTSVTKGELLSVLKDASRVNEHVKFDEKRGRPQMLVKEGKRGFSVTCRYIGGASKDNGFIIGTVFVGKITEKNGVTRLSGIITTAPLYYAVILGLLIYSVIRGIALGGFNPIALIIAVFSVIMFLPEFKKQGIIDRYLARAIKFAEQGKNER